ncbi:MAG: hypothetical protein HC940_00890 [Acaryochloris sp. SU_5_25]|nr:hypothetical protein [Acaryochloris sp. SU_5_25]
MCDLMGVPHGNDLTPYALYPNTPAKDLYLGIPVKPDGQNLQSEAILESPVSIAIPNEEPERPIDEVFPPSSRLRVLSLFIPPGQREEALGDLVERRQELSEILAEKYPKFRRELKRLRLFLFLVHSIFNIAHLWDMQGRFWFLDWLDRLEILQNALKNMDVFFDYLESWLKGEPRNED